MTSWCGLKCVMLPKGLALPSLYSQILRKESLFWHFFPHSLWTNVICDWPVSPQGSWEQQGLWQEQPLWGQQRMKLPRVPARSLMGAHPSCKSSGWWVNWVWVGDDPWTPERFLLSFVKCYHKTLPAWTPHGRDMLDRWALLVDLALGAQPHLQAHSQQCWDIFRPSQAICIS